MNDDTQKAVAPHFDKAQFEAAVAASDKKPVFVDFYAEWCGPCKLAEPIIDKLSEEYADSVVVAKLNVDDFSEIAGAYAVMSIPTVLVFKNGKVTGRKVGFAGEEGYRQLLDAAISSDTKLAKAA